MFVDVCGCLWILWMFVDVCGVQSKKADFNTKQAAHDSSVYQSVVSFQ